MLLSSYKMLQCVYIIQVVHKVVIEVGTNIKFSEATSKPTVLSVYLMKFMELEWFLSFRRKILLTETDIMLVSH
jgi:hypothetical protein